MIWGNTEILANTFSHTVISTILTFRKLSGYDWAEGPLKDFLFLVRNEYDEKKN